MKLLSLKTYAGALNAVWCVASSLNAPSWYAHFTVPAGIVRTLSAPYVGARLILYSQPLVEARKILGPMTAGVLGMPRSSPRYAIDSPPSPVGSQLRRGVPSSARRT